MKLRIAWNYPALFIFNDLPMHTAMLVDRAVIRFAETGEGEIERIPPHYRLRIGAYRVRFAVDHDTGTMNVLYLYRVR